jgi:hypothetical protein
MNWQVGGEFYNAADKREKKILKPSIIPTFKILSSRSAMNLKIKKAINGCRIELVLNLLSSTLD